jgi:transcriptional regulator with XRE-family HTH domain
VGSALVNREGEILRERRLELGMSQQEVAVEVGLHIRQYQRFEYGERQLSNCSLKMGLKICAVLELDPYELLLTDDR